MKRTISITTALVLMGLLTRPAVALPQVGDVPPPLKITEWVRGDDVDLKRDAAKKIHLIEFWATWCPPCKASVPLLTDYQKQYTKDLVIVGVTDAEPLRNSVKEVRRFVKKQGANMEYTVAIDDAGKTWNAWLNPAMGIPYAFLINRDGRIVWQGSPLEPSLAEILPAVIDGSYDVKSAKLEAEVNRRLQALSLSLEMGQWGTVWDGLIDILKLDPANEVAIDALTSIYAKELRNTRSFRKWVTGHIDAHSGNANSMSRLALALLRNDDYATRAPDLALRAAKSAYEASKKRDARAIAVYAQAVYQIGNLDMAITVQAEAVALASEGQRKNAQDILDYYKLCKELSQSHG